MEDEPKTSENKRVLFVPVAVATTIDNYLILQLKQIKFADKPEQLQVITQEVSVYQPIIDEIIVAYPNLTEQMAALRQIHERLWEIEDRKRMIEGGEDEEKMIVRLRSETNGLLEEYLALSRQVSKFNDQRALIKKQINTITNSAIEEIKSHKTINA
ncbi:MAG: hypothetical protein WC702_03495 [Patescibacteria group bacterium]|jgi:hypothetical protein